MYLTQSTSKNSMTNSDKVNEILNRLYKIWPEPKSALDFNNPLELLVATMLSAQTTDKLVNSITPDLFKAFPNAQAYADATVEAIDEFIKKTNFHKNKAKNINSMTKILVEKYNGEVPRTMAELDDLPGVARKTANVVLGNAFGIESGIVVDSHVKRLSNQLGLTTESDPVKIEQDLMKIVPKGKWVDFSHLIINYGRTYSTARRHCKDTEILGDLCA